MLRADAASDSLDILENEWVDYLGQSVLQLFILVSVRNTNVQMDVSISNVSVTCGLYPFLLGISQFRTLLDQVPCFLDYVVEVLRT